MDTKEFLEAVWPASGIYCYATPFGSTYAHKTFTSISAFCDQVASDRDKENIFFCVHTLKQRQVWNDAKMAWDPDRPRTKPDGSIHTGPYGAYEVRTHDNMSEAKCFFFDLDVGESTSTLPKYPTRQEALDGLEAFLFRTGLPSPLVTSSGGGFHVYWLLTDAIPSLEWRGWAAKLHHVARRLGLRADPSRTTDQSSVLRVVGTQNLKPGRGPRPCVAVQAAVPTPTAAFLARLTALVGNDIVNTPSGSAQRSRASARGNLEKSWDGPVRDIAEVVEVCEHVRNYARDGYVEGGYPIFYNLGCGIIPFTYEGEALAMDLALKHPRCTEDYAERGIATWARKSDGPSSCANLDAKCGGDACARCPFSALGKNPLIIATEYQKSKLLPPRTVEQALAAPEIVVDPPYPFKRKDGKITETIIEIVKGEEVVENRLVCPYDMFPYAMLDKTPGEQAFQMWAFKIPHKKDLVEIKVTAGMMTETKILKTELSNNGVHITDAQFKRTAHLMQVWLQDLQQKIAANRQFDHLGWVNQSVEEFIMPDRVYKLDGTTAPSTLSAMAKDSMSFVHKKGTLEGSLKALEFYNRPEYIKHQFLIMLALGAPLWQATGHAGCTVNASGESGGSKSTVLYGGASLWGSPEHYTINGTSAGATAMAKADMIFTFSNLPVFVDEITKMSNEAINEFVYNSTQREPKRRLKPDGTPRPIRVQWKATPLITSANVSLHNVLSKENSAGRAGNMRVFEIEYPTLDESHKPLAGAFMRDINKHYGHIGPEFLAIYMRKRVEIDTACFGLIDTISTNLKMGAAERYWTDVMGVGLLTGQLAYQAKLLPFKIEPIRDWLFGEQLREMRNEIGVQNVDDDPLTLLGNFINDKMSSTIVVLPPDRDGVCHALRAPVHEIVAHEDKHTNQLHIRRDAFRTWCERHKKNGHQAIKKLEARRIVHDDGRKRVLGLGTNFAIARTVCFSVDLANEEISGILGSKVVATTALRAVK